MFLEKLIFLVGISKYTYFMLFYDEEINTTYVEIFSILAKINRFEVHKKRVTYFSFLPPGLMKIKSKLYKQKLWFHNGG